MNELLKYTSQNWHEVTTEHERNFRLCSGLTRKTESKFKRIQKYGYPRKCPAIKNIQSLIIFTI